MVSCRHMCVCACMHVCTYIIHVHQGMGQKNKEYNTYIRKGGMSVRGTEEALLILGVQVLSAEAPLPCSMSEWVGGEKKGFH